MSGRGPGRTKLLSAPEVVWRTRPQRRVREEVRDGVAVVAFSAVASTALAAVLVLLSALAG